MAAPAFAAYSMPYRHIALTVCTRDASIPSSPGRVLHIADNEKHKNRVGIMGPAVWCLGAEAAHEEDLGHDHQ